MIIAVKQGDLPQLNQLIASGADVNYRHPLGWTALHTAVINGNLGAVKCLVRRGADVNMRDEFSTARRVARKQGISSERGEDTPLK